MLIYIALFFASIICISCPAMDDCTIALCDYALDRYKLVINEELLKTIEAPNAKTLLAQVQTYYAQQPAHQTTYKAYMLKPVCNIKKIGAYFELLCATSLDVRESTPENQQEEGPVDSQILPQVRREWPIVSVMYDLQDMQGKIKAFQEWAAQKFTPIPNNPRIQALWGRVKNDYDQTTRAITICSQYKIYLNNHVSFVNSNE